MKLRKPAIQRKCTHVSLTPWHPSYKAMMRVKNQLPPPTTCPICSGSVRIAHHQEIYGKVMGKWPWVFYCESCGAHVGMHPQTNIPLGILANAATRAARVKSKERFLFITRKFFNDDRNAAYAWLANNLGLQQEKCHFGWFNIKMCKKAERVCNRMIIFREESPQKTTSTS